MTASSREKIWFYYSRETQVGPVDQIELRSAIEGGLLTQKDYVYREGFTDWKLLEEVSELRGISEKKVSIIRTPAPPVRASDKRTGSKRVPIQEMVVAHNDAHVATGLISNISVSGVFFETIDRVFKLNDEVKLTLKEGKGLGKPMHLRGIVVRQCREGLAGYGLELRGLDETSRARIQDYIKRNHAS